MSNNSHILPHFVTRGFNILKNEGIMICLYKIRERLRGSGYYEKWITEKEKEEALLRKKTNEQFEYRPVISILIPVYNTKRDILKECIESVIAQEYDNWQLCIADDCSTMPEVRDVLEEYRKDKRISGRTDIIFRTENGHISKATNTALEMAKGEYIALLDCDDTLAPNALYEVVKVLNSNKDIDFIYTDEDKIDGRSGRRNTPHFKTDWSPDTLMSYMYTCHMSVYRTKIVRSLGGFRDGLEGAQDYDLVLRFTESIHKSHIYHIPKVLYHWRTDSGSTSVDASKKPYILKATKDAKEEALKRRDIDAKLEYIEELGGYRVNYIPGIDDIVSIIIPSKDNPDVLERCIKSIREKTAFENYEITVVDNGSNSDNKKIYESHSGKYGFNYIYEKMEFNFSRMCNIGAKAAGGSFFLFLNDDTEVIEGEWLERMLGHAKLSYAGAVGAKLLYPDSNIIQHTGVINIASGPSHALCGYSNEDVCAFARNLFEFNYLAVTAACMMISKEKFFEVGGFNEDMTISYNDVELCMRLVEKGYYNVVRNDAVLYHYESYSRGYDIVDENKIKRLMVERDRLYRLHPQFAPGRHMDPFYNENLAQNCLDFSCNFDNIGSYVSSRKTRKLKDYRIDDNIRYKIDNIVAGSGLSVNGWAYVDKGHFNNIRKVRFLVIIDEENVHEYDTLSLYRPDVGSMIHEKKLYMTGFQFATDHQYEKEVKYAVAIGNKMKYISLNYGGL